VDVLLSPSAYTAERHRDAGLRIPIHVLPSFTQLTGLDEPLELPERPTFLFVGRVTAAKGILELAEEFSQLPEYDLLVLGEGDLLRKLRARYAQYSNLRFLGAVPHDEVVSMYRRATAVIVPSLAPEVFPLSIIEALACGTPAIVRNAGGTREAIDQTGGGIVYKSSAELHQALQRLTTETIRRNLAERAREGYRRHYSQEVYLERYLSLIDALLARKRHGSVTAAPRH
jgi:glycosyltransferase involved in cell wall biosynthesis